MNNNRKQTNFLQLFDIAFQTFQTFDTKADPTIDWIIHLCVRVEIDLFLFEYQIVKSLKA